MRRRFATISHGAIIRSLTVCALLAAAGVVAISTGGNVRAQDAEELPNILIIVTDDQRATQTLEAMPQTRRIFERNGTNFPNAFATTPLCCPARASIFSGRYAHNHGVVRSNVDPEVFDQESTLQARLRGAGYSTALAGKYLNNWPQSSDPPYFHRWASFSRGLQANSNGYSNLTFNDDGVQRTADNYSTHFIRNRALEFLNWFEFDDNRPWFLYVAPFAPHAPARPEAAYSRVPFPLWQQTPATFEQDVGDKPGYVQGSNPNPRRVSKLRVRQLRSLISVDDMVGRLFDKLDTLGEKENTLAVFLSDNGYMWGEQRRLGKSVPYLPSTTIPMLMRWPGQVVRGAIDPRLVSNIDVAPTALDAVGLPGEGMDGRSLIDGTWDRDRMLLEFREARTIQVPSWASLVTPGHQYTEYYEGGPDAEVVIEREFYDLSADPFQLENLLADDDSMNDPPQGMVDQLAADRRCAGASCP